MPQGHCLFLLMQDFLSSAQKLEKFFKDNLANYHWEPCWKDQRTTAFPSLHRNDSAHCTTKIFCKTKQTNLSTTIFGKKHGLGEDVVPFLCLGLLLGGLQIPRLSWRLLFDPTSDLVFLFEYIEFMKKNGEKSLGSRFVMVFSICAVALVFLTLHQSHGLMLPFITFCIERGIFLRSESPQKNSSIFNWSPLWTETKWRNDLAGASLLACSQLHVKMVRVPSWRRHSDGAKGLDIFPGTSPFFQWTRALLFPNQTEK